MIQNVSKDMVLSELKAIDNDFTASISEFCDIEILNINNSLKAINDKLFKQKKIAVLGYDIYKYSQYEDEKQTFIPFIFEYLIDDAIRMAKESEETFFKDYNKNIISTGDGGFILFSEPFQAFLFNLYFYTLLHLFNTGHLYPKLSHFVGEIVIRSAITFDNIYSYEANSYGKGIINNSRILKRDKLNRFLIDKNTYNYFEKKINGLESIQIISREMIKKIFNINDSIKSVTFKKESYNPLNEVYKNENILNIHIQKIENIISKETELTVYNIEIQILTSIYNYSNLCENTSYVLSIGNTNPL